MVAAISFSNLRSGITTRMSISDLAVAAPFTYEPNNMSVKKGEEIFDVKSLTSISISRCPAKNRLARIASM